MLVVLLCWQGFCINLWRYSVAVEIVQHSRNFSFSESKTGSCPVDVDAGAHWLGQNTKYFLCTFAMLWTQQFNIFCTFVYLFCFLFLLLFFELQPFTLLPKSGSGVFVRHVPSSHQYWIWSGHTLVDWYQLKWPNSKSDSFITVLCFTHLSLLVLQLSFKTAKLYTAASCSCFTLQHHCTTTSELIFFL